MITHDVLKATLPRWPFYCQRVSPFQLYSAFEYETFCITYLAFASLAVHQCHDFMRSVVYKRTCSSYAKLSTGIVPIIIVRISTIYVTEFDWEKNDE